MLRYVLHSVLVTPAQLRELLNTDRIQTSRTALQNRLHRLGSRGLLEPQSLLLPNIHTGYRITAAGAALLVDAGEHCAEQFEEVFPVRPPAHWIALTQLRIALRRAGHLSSWLPRIEIHYRNRLQYAAFPIHYDAIVTVGKSKVGCIQVGLLYESSLRTAAEYRDLQHKLEQEWQLHWILCLAPEPHASYWLRNQFTPSNKCIGITTIEEFEHHRLDAPTYLVGTGRSSPLIELLREKIRPGFDFDVTGTTPLLSA